MTAKVSTGSGEKSHNNFHESNFSKVNEMDASYGKNSPGLQTQQTQTWQTFF